MVADTGIEEVMSHLGDFGKYQLGQFFLHILGAMTAGMHMLSLVIIAAVPDFTCNVPGFTEGSPLPNAIDSCYYKDTNNMKQACTSWTYDTTYFKSSRAVDWDMVCFRRWMSATAQTVYMLGVFGGAIVIGSLADKYGRKRTFNVSATLQLIVSISIAFVPEYYSFLVVEFFYGAFGSAGCYITGFVLSMELIGASKRTVCGVCFQMSFAVGVMFVAGWGQLFQDRFWLQITYGLHSSILIVHWWIMDESPRWLWSQNRIEEALAIVQKGLKKNKSSVVLSVDKYTSKTESEVDPESKKYNVFHLFKTTSKLRNKTLNICFNWFTHSIVYYGLSFSTTHILKNPYLMLLLNGFIEVPCYLFTILVMDRAGRRSLISSMMVIGGVSCIISAFLGKLIVNASVSTAVIVLIGKFCIAASFAVLYNYTAELFPTVLRNTVFGLSTMCTRFSGAMTPWIILLDTLDPKIPISLFGIFSIVAGLLSLYLPETFNKPMPQTLEDVM